MFKRKSAVVSKVLPVLLAAVLAACTDLGAVRDWSATSMEAAQFNEIVTTYADTPDRLVAYDDAKAGFWQKQAKARAAQAKALEIQLTIVADYMGALSALSADSATDYTGDVKTVKTALKKTGKVSDATLGAAGELVTTILNAATNLWQRRKVGELIEDANTPLQNLLAGELRSIVDDDFRRDLLTEGQFLNRHFKDLLRHGGGSKAANAALNEWFLLRQDENQRRFAAVDAYLGVLDKIAEGHQKLFDSRGDLDAVSLVRDLYKLAKEIRANVKEIVKT